MDFKNHKCIFPADNSVYNRLKVGPKKNQIENDEHGTKWEINRYYIKKFLPWITNWKFFSPYSTVEIIEDHSNDKQSNGEQIVFLYSSPSCKSAVLDNDGSSSSLALAVRHQ